MPSAQSTRAVFAMDPVHLPLLFPPPLMARLRQVAEIDPGFVVRDFADPGAASTLAGAEVLITGWGCPHLDADVLTAVPGLRTVLHAAGSVRALVGEALWHAGVTVSSAAAGNALPVAEYTLAMILLAGKDAFDQRERFRQTHTYPSPAETAAIGNVGRRVGVIGASRVGRRLLELLKPFDFAVSLHDPYVDTAGGAA
ncbi:NAD(P)-dependent oxidoreductase, partial [Streptomyces scabiei]|uniref:NAD(P)-dependent oxidoreductase n=1 Tax=Streptomyces scabiei TaxID=1930 RepID=UPI0022772AC2